MGRMGFVARVSLGIGAAVAMSLPAPAPAWSQLAEIHSDMWGGKFPVGLKYSDPPAGDAEFKAIDELVKEIVGAVELQPEFKLKAVQDRSFLNAFARFAPDAPLNQNRYIVYGAEYMKGVANRKPEERNWKAFVTLAHEIAHHLNADTLDSLGSTPDAELKADLFAGAAVKRAGGRLQDAVAVYATAPEAASTTHPARADRIKWVTLGYNEARAFEEQRHTVNTWAWSGGRWVPTPRLFVSRKIETFPEGRFRPWGEFQIIGDKQGDEVRSNWREIAREGTTVFLYDFGGRVWLKIARNSGAGVDTAFISQGPAPSKLIEAPAPKSPGKNRVAFYDQVAAGAAWLPLHPKFTMKAGPIWNQPDARGKCLAACKLTWNGQWATVLEGHMSVCGASNAATLSKGEGADGDGIQQRWGNGPDVKGDIPIGPIWNNNEAKAKCEAALSQIAWNGHWWTTVSGQMSVCECSIR